MMPKKISLTKKLNRIIYSFNNPSAYRLLTQRQRIKVAFHLTFYFNLPFTIGDIYNSLTVDNPGNCATISRILDIETFFSLRMENWLSILLRNNLLISISNLPSKQHICIIFSQETLLSHKENISKTTRNIWKNNTLS